MKRLIYAGVAAVLFVSNPSFSQWSRVQLDGQQLCQRETGELFEPPYGGKSDVTKSCNTIGFFERWLGTAEGAIISRQLTQDASGKYDETCPSGDCTVDPGLPAGWAFVTISGTTEPLTNSSSSYQDNGYGVAETFNIQTTGGAIYYTNDSTEAAYYDGSTGTDLTFITRLDRLSTSASGKAGIDLRNTTDATNVDPPRVGCFIWNQSNGGYVCDGRTTEGGATSILYDDQAGAVTLPDDGCLRAQVDRASSSVTFSYSSDCSTWTVFYTGFPSWAASGNVMAMLPCGRVGGSGTPTCEANYEGGDTSVSTADVGAPSAGTVSIDSTVSCSEDVSTCNLPVNLAGTSNGGCSVNGTITIGGGGYGLSPSSVSFSDMESNTSDNLTLTGISDVTGNQNLQVMIAKGTCPNDSLGNTTIAITIVDNDSSNIIFEAGGETRATISGATNLAKDTNTFRAEWAIPTDPDYAFGQICWGTDASSPAPSNPKSSATCNYPDVFMYSQDDSSNGGPSTACEGSWFLRLKRTSTQAQAFYLPNGGGNRVGVQQNDFNAVGEQAKIGFCVYLPSNANGYDITQLNHWGNGGNYAVGTYSPYEVGNHIWSFIGGYHGAGGGFPTSWGFAFVRDPDSGNVGKLVIYSRTQATSPADWNQMTERVHYNAVMPRDQWIHFEAFHVNNPSGGGSLEVWMNGTKIVDYSGPFGFPVNTFPYWMSYAGDDNPHNRQFYLDAVRIGNSSATRTELCGTHCD